MQMTRDAEAGAGATGLMDWRAARAAGLALAAPVGGTETLPLAGATGRVTAEAAISPIPLPPFDNSAMDGFALATADLGGPGPWRLAVAGRVAAGEAASPLPPGTCLRILTGAPIPPGADQEAWGERLPLPWYVERTGATTDSVGDPADLDGEPAVVIADPADADVLADDLAGYETREIRLALRDREVVVFVRS